MKAIDYNTRLFKNIFPDYATFKAWYTSTPLSDDLNDAPTEKTFTLIAYEYNDSHVSMSPESFKEHFANDLYTYYKEFENTTDAIKRIMDMSEEDLSLGDKMITNFGDIPETTGNTNILTVESVTNQQKQFVQKSKANINRESLRNQRAFTVKTFLKRFKHLFITVLSPAYTFVVEEDEGEE